MDKNQLGVKYMQEGNLEEAAKAFYEAINENGQDPIAYINFGNVLSALGDNDKALQFFQKAIEIDENAAAAYYSAGNLYYSNGQFSQAKDMFESAMKKGLESSDNFFLLGMSLMKLGQQKLAIPFLQRSVELNGDDLEARFEFGMCLLQNEYIEEAIAQFEECLMIDENYANACYFLGLSSAFKGNEGKALEMLEKGLRLDPEHLMALQATTLIEKLKA
ncbi:MULTISPECIES: tetratricopeptide repeat protein [Bacillaceae]|uniref:tetratricopeptide repeat protein n=1 Tax=Bacillaceae TaxID=186817 RepID=UPI002FFDE5ED